MEPALIASICFNVVLTIIIIALFCKYFQMRKCFSRGCSDFRRLEETTSSKRMLSNENNANNYSSIESETGHEAIKKREIEKNKTNSQNIRTSDNTATTEKCISDIEREEVGSEKEYNRDEHSGESSMVPTISNIDETNKIVDQHTEEETMKKDVDTDTRLIDLNDGDTNKAVDIPTDETFKKMLSEGEPGIQDEVILNVREADDVDDKLLDQTSGVIPELHDSSTDNEIIIKPTINVQVFSRDDNPIVRSAIEEVMSKLNSLSDLMVNYSQVPDIALVNPDHPLFVICMNTSRLGTDATNAIKGMKHPSMTVLLILHHQAKHALPVNRSDRKLVDDQFKNMGGIFDFAFKQESGMYPCDMNSTCIDELSRFVRKCLDS